MTIDTIVTVASAIALCIIGLFVLYSVLHKLMIEPGWYRCPRCGRWQDELGEYGIPPREDLIDGDNLCSSCERENQP